jgi:hypothetical protein
MVFKNSSVFTNTGFQNKCLVAKLSLTKVGHTALGVERAKSGRKCT